MKIAARIGCFDDNDNGNDQPTFVHDAYDADASSLAAPIVVRQDTHKLPAPVRASGVEASHVDDDGDAALRLSPSSNSPEDGRLMCALSSGYLYCELSSLSMR